MRSNRGRVAGGIVLTAMALTGCAEQSITGPGAPESVTTATPSFVVSQTIGPNCRLVDFNSFAHGDAVTSISIADFGLNLTVSAQRFEQGGGIVAATARAFDTDTPATSSDPSIDPTSDLRHSPAPHARCSACAGLENLLVIELFTPPPVVDNTYGGRISFTNWGSGSFFIQSFNVVDNDGVEPFRLFVDGVQTGSSTPGADGNVQTVTASSTPTIASSVVFQLGTPEGDDITGSGAIDNIVVCQQETTGGEGCTLGYWSKEHHFDSWSGYTPGQSLNTVFDFAGGAASFASLGSNSFLTALGYSGGPTAIAAARLLLKQAVAALLNAASPGVDYALTTAQIVSQVNAALDTQNRDTMLALKDRLDRFNNAGCPLD